MEEDGPVIVAINNPYLATLQIHKNGFASLIATSLDRPLILNVSELCYSSKETYKIELVLANNFLGVSRGLHLKPTETQLLKIVIYTPKVKLFLFSHSELKEVLNPDL